ncbi:MAG: hypothetical protein ACD_42C00498G0012 [uncultured bacterium]|nr:MAG: hypothetical protein ACD_42C00498G0012 [uncultured bacterium]
MQIACNFFAQGENTVKEASAETAHRAVSGVSSDVEKILGKNFLRVASAVWK